MLISIKKGAYHQKCSSVRHPGYHPSMVSETAFSVLRCIFLVSPPKTIRVFQYPPRYLQREKLPSLLCHRMMIWNMESIGSKTSKSYQYLEREFWRILPASKVRFGIDTENHHRSDGNHMMCPTYYFSMATIQER